MKIKEFFKEHDHLKLELQHLGLYGGCWKMQIYNTTSACIYEPIYEYCLLDEEIDNLVVDFETAIMTPILSWWNNYETKNRMDILNASRAVCPWK